MKRMKISRSGKECHNIPDFTFSSASSSGLLCLAPNHWNKAGLIHNTCTTTNCKASNTKRTHLNLKQKIKIAELNHMQKSWNSTNKKDETFNQNSEKQKDATKAPDPYMSNPVKTLLQNDGDDNQPSTNTCHSPCGCLIELPWTRIHSHETQQIKPAATYFSNTKSSQTLLLHFPIPLLPKPQKISKWVV